MANLSKKSLILCSLILALSFGLFGCVKKPVIVNQNQNVNVNNNTNAATTTAEDINIHNLVTYKSNYGYELKYPKGYKNNNEYSIWVSHSSVVNLLEEWGVNKFQETIFGINVYKRGDKSKIVDYYNYHLTGKKIIINNGIVAERYDSTVAIVERGDYVYIIYSSFMNLPSKIEEYKEFKNILDSLKFD